MGIKIRVIDKSQQKQEYEKKTKILLLRNAECSAKGQPLLTLKSLERHGRGSKPQPLTFEASVIAVVLCEKFPGSRKLPCGCD